MNIPTCFKSETEFLQNVLQKKESNASLKVLRTDFTAACNTGDNFMSNVFRCSLTVKDIFNVSERHLIMKEKLSNAIWREAFGCDQAFANEATSYHSVVPELNKFRKNDKLAFPQCFYASVDFTILEDLKPLGFKMADRQEGLDFAHAKIALKELGRFHGTSLAMKHSQPKIFEKLASSVHEIVFVTEKKNEFESALVNSIRIAAMSLKVFRAIGTKSLDDVIKKLEIISNSAYERLLQQVRPRGPLSVVCHGDFYVNNLLFKYDNDGEVCAVKIVDLQAFRCASLSLDLLYFINTSLRPGVVASHFWQLMEIYRTSLNEQIQEFAPNAAQISLKELVDELESHSTFGLIMGLLVLPAVTAIPGSVANIDKVVSFSPRDTFERGVDMLSAGYFRRLFQLVTDYAELGYL